MQPDKKTVIRLIRLNPKKLGSFEEYIIASNEELNKRGFHSVVIFTDAVPAHLQPLYHNCEVFHLSKEKLGALIFYYRLFKLLRKYKPNIVHISFYPIFSPLVFLLYIFGAHKIIFSDDFSGALKPKKTLKRLLVSSRNKFLCMFIKKIICVSNYVAERDKNIPGMAHSKLICILNGVNLERFSKDKVDYLKFRSELGVAKTDFLVINVSNLIKVKGVEDIIRAAQILSGKYKDILFLIAGAGDYAKELESKVKEYNLESKVRFLGLRNDTEKLLAVSDVFVYPSLWQEACAFGLIEALACGVPVIATAVGGTPQLVKDGLTGILLKPGDYITLADRVEYLYRNRAVQREMSEAAEADARTRFDLKRMVKEISDIYGQYI